MYFNGNGSLSVSSAQQGSQTQMQMGQSPTAPHYVLLNTMTQQSVVGNTNAPSAAQFVPAPAGGLFYVFVPPHQQMPPNNGTMPDSNGSYGQLLAASASPHHTMTAFPVMAPQDVFAASSLQSRANGSGSGSAVDLINSLGGIPRVTQQSASWTVAPAPPPPPPPPQMMSQVTAPPPPPPPPMHQSMQQPHPQAAMIHRTGNVHDALRQHGCIFATYDGPTLDAEQCMTGGKLPTMVVNGVTSGATSSNSPSSSPNNSLGSKPTEVEMMVPFTSDNTNCSGNQLQQQQQQQQQQGKPAMAYTFFVSSFPTEKMECAQYLLTRVLQIVCSGIHSETPSDSPDGPPVKVLPWVSAISFLNANSRGSSHSFYAKVHTDDPQLLMKKLKGSIMMDRLGFHWAASSSAKRQMEQYSKSIWNLPQALRHRRTEWLPCTPLIIDLALDTSKVRWYK